MKKIIIISIFSYLVSIALIQAQVISDSILVDGNYRTFHHNKPGSLKKGASLVFVLHGSGGNGIDLMDRTANLRQKTVNENVLLVYPNGYKKYWNECRKVASSLANQENINEEAFFGGMIDYFAKKYKIDEKQVFAVGTSGGGHMCYKLAMTMSGRFSAVAAIIAGWAVAQNPVFLHGLTVRQAAAGHDTLVAVVVAVLAGAVLLFPALALLFRLTLGGRLGYGEERSREPSGGFRGQQADGRLSVRLALAFLVAGIGFLTIAHAAWAHAIGVACFFGFILAGYRGALPADVAGVED